jgi:hypothetical protein
MPILNHFIDNEIFGPAIRQGRAEGQMDILTDLIMKRFGSVPSGVRKQLAMLKPEQIKAAVQRAVDTLWGILRP